MQWSWSYLTFARGTRLIVEKEWRSFAKKGEAVEPARVLREDTSEAFANGVFGASDVLPASPPAGGAVRGGARVGRLPSL